MTMMNDKKKRLDDEEIVDFSEMPSLEDNEEEVKEIKRIKNLNFKQTINQSSTITRKNKIWK